ncbi:formate dehydrogenase subunit delta [Microvirga puerhi]|uniref:Formate dehydrogenase subunit delta n=1 Tax=Microvirga puerhi TaxID=2876078 RepID=A0ABS7VS62_9HYPH|nr:formate dehydrogenase subunit delta [Microvirga puerhi]MBZ6078388.1 formate dehydrogenase subunit delta [Microvirga puerhi]
MTTQKLARMANQIADFFRSYPEQQAITGIRDHIAAFWTPHMRDALLADLERGEGKLDLLVTKALQTFRTAESPIEKQIAGPEQLGQLESDAG